jgi:predicted trehalose synthase
MAKTALKSLADIDGRTVAARQARDLAKQIETDLGGDLSAAQHELVTRVALLSAFLADCEARWLAGGDVDVSAWLSAVDRQRRLLATLGLERRARPVPDIQTYLREKYGEKP